jgi:hypothetical protein
MMIDELKFGSITIDGQKYGQVLIINGKVLERNHDFLEKEFGTTHKISFEEGEKLLQEKPEYIIIGNGFNGVMEVEPEMKEKLQKNGAKILILHSPIAVKKFNDLIKQGRRVNALIHTTC